MQEIAAVPWLVKYLVDGALIGLVAVLVLVFVVWPILRVRCENCGEELRMWRIPPNRQQAFFGGWTCPNCGRELDRRGRLRATR